MESSLQKCEHSTLNEFACFPLTYTFHEPNSITAPKVNFELALTLESLYRGRSTRKHARVDGAVNKGLERAKTKVAQLKRILGLLLVLARS